MKLKAWLNAARLRTLPLSISGIVVGYALASMYDCENVVVFILALLTTVSFQITSNFANDYGDGIKGTDNEDRIGPKRALQSGLLTAKELKNGIKVSIFIALLLVGLLLYMAFGDENIIYIFVFGVLGLLSVWAAVRYTVGKSAYGYKGLGDIFVFVFFGLVAVLGTLFLFSKNIPTTSILPATTIGLLSVSVLNLNNLRDFESDKKAKKNTLIVKMGFKMGKKYHFLLIIISFFCNLLFTVFHFESFVNLCWIVSFIPIIPHFIRIYKNRNPIEIDPELKIIALSTFFFALLFYFSFNNFL